MDEYVEHLKLVLDVLRKEKLFANLKKCTFCMDKLVFLGFVFDPGDWVWLQIRKEWFPVQRRSKLFPTGDGRFQVLERINDNAYKLDLPGEYNIKCKL